jgi:hypothetical protein
VDTEDRNHELVHSTKIRAGKRRTYFIDIRTTKGGDYYITLTESLRHHDGWEKHKILLYKEDFNRFIDALDDAIYHVKTELLPDFDFEKFDRQHEEWERERSNPENALPDNEAEEVDKDDQPDAE